MTYVDTLIAAADALPEITRRIVDGFNPLQLILFGSRARGDARWDSDYDLLVVMPDGNDRRETAMAIRRSLADMPLGKDVLVVTPDLIDRPGMIRSLLNHAFAEGRTLYERT
jgi:predicted nucleotidyltransferase